MSERTPPKKDYPVARGVSPPPRRAAAPSLRRSDGQQIIVRRPAGRSPHRGWTLAVEIGAVVVLAGFFMAAGWLVFGHNKSDAPEPARQARAEPAVVTKPGVVEPPKPVERPAVAAPASPPVANAPGSPKIEKPVAPPVKPSPPPPAAPAVTNLTFQRDIFPILKSKCYTCHGENKKKLKGGLDVSTVKLLEKGGDGGPVIDRKNPEASALWESVANGQMPPGKGTKLTESEKKKLHAWLVGGGT